MHIHEISFADEKQPAFSENEVNVSYPRIRQ
jgi:hypothetical protein